MKIKEFSELVSISSTGSMDRKSHPGPSDPNLLSISQAAFLLVAAVVGLGIMALPSSIAKVGWVPGLVILGTVFSVNLYTGLLWRLRLVYPHGTNYTHIGMEVMGLTGKRLAQVVTLTQLFLLEASYMLVNTQSLAAVFYELDLCKPTWGIFMAFLLLPFVQIRTLNNVSLLSLISGVMVFFVLALCVVEMAIHGREPHVHTALVESSPPFVWFRAVSSMVFACGSQFVYLEIMSEMQSVKDFPPALGRAASFIITAYISISAAGYWTYGRHVPSYVVDVIPNGPFRRIANVFMLIHTMVSYILMSQVLCNSLVKLVHPIKRSLSDPGPISDSGREADVVPNREDWLVTSMLVMLCAYLVANVVPFFEELTVLIGALIGGPISLGIPALFTIRARKLGKVEYGRAEHLWLHGLIGLTAIIMVLGLASGVDSLFVKWDTFGYPFECHCIECAEL